MTYLEGDGPLAEEMLVAVEIPLAARAGL